MLRCPELIESSIKSRIADFQLTGSKDAHRLYEQLDLLTEVASLMEDIRYTHLLSYYNTSYGVRPIISKLPLKLRNKWTTRAARYQNQYQVAFPPFRELLQFIRETAKIMNNPCFNYDTPSAHVGNERICWLIPRKQTLMMNVQKEVMDQIQTYSVLTTIHQITPSTIVSSFVGKV